MTNIKILTISSQTFYYIPKKLGFFFPNLEVIYVYASSFQTLWPSDLEQFPNLREININYNAISELDDNLFRKNPNITRIAFQNNGGQLKYIGGKILDKLAKFISATFGGGCLGSKSYTGRSLIATFKKDVATSCQLTEAERGKFSRMVLPQVNVMKSNLDVASWYYYMSIKNRISTIDSKPKSLVLTCNFLTRPELCDVEELKLKYRNTPISRVEDETGKETKPEDTKFMKIVDQQTFFLPTGLGDYFPSLTNLSVVKSGLFSFTPSDFKGFEKLINLNLSDNVIHEIPTDSFKYLLNLLSLNLSYNSIIDLQEGSFTGLKKLEILLLDNNKIEMIRDQSFDDLVSLKELTLHSNPLKYIGVNILSNLKSLTSLDMTNNECIDKKFPETPLNEIEKIFLDKCIAPADLGCWFTSEKLSLTESKTISGYSCKAKDGFIIKYAKTKVFLADSEHNGWSNKDVVAFIGRNMEIKFVPYGMSEVFPKLAILVIMDSGLTSILNLDFEGLGNLKEIMIINNNISVIENDSFREVRNLEYLDLSENRIVTLPTKIFSHLESLKTLILSSNPLITLPFDIIPMFSVMEEFHASKCDLKIIETRIFKYMKQAKVINLERNNCTDVYYKKSEMKFAEMYIDVNIYCCYDHCF